MVREFTADYQDEFSTIIEVNYLPAINTTKLAVIFPSPIFDYSSLKLPNECYLKVNGVDFIWDENVSGYYLELQGKPICTIEFKDIDGEIYKNTLVPPDTAYFIDFPDTVKNSNDFVFQINAPVLDSNENSGICTNCGFYERDWLNRGTDTLINLYVNPFFNLHSLNTLFLYRGKTIANPKLPVGGGSIVYYYITQKSFYIE